VSAPQPGAPGPAGLPGQPQMPAAPGPAGTPVAPPSSTPPGAPTKRGRSRARGVGLTVAAALLIFVTVLFVLFIVFNTQTVRINLVFSEVQAPLVVALLIAAGLGGLLVALLSLVSRSRRSGR
jgi:uncharacterized integral membrane protein